VSATLSVVPLPPGARFVADLHLEPDVRAPWEAFQTFLQTCAGAPALFVLGDLFEFWIGRGQLREPDYVPLLDALRACARGGTALHFLHGNRDFLLGAEFAARVEGAVHPHGVVAARADGTRVLLLHGDELATRDHSYQRLRRVLRAPLVAGTARRLPFGLAAALARGLRRRSRAAVARKSEAYVELQPEAARRALAAVGADELVCGHAHRYRHEVLDAGRTWTVLDAFGGPRDLLLEVSGQGLVSASSRAALHPGARPLSSGAPMIIALDGPAGVGKSSVARALARALDFFFLDTGAMYRAVTLVVLERGLAPGDAEGCAEVARALRLDFDAQGRIRIDGRAGEPAIRGSDVTAHVSEVSAHAGVREAIVAEQRALAERSKGVVAEGRDTTTVVFPRATFKFYLDASPAERARRRARQEHALERVGEIQVDLERRDRHDSSRVHSPLRAAEDALRIETDGLELEAVVARILAHVRARA